MEITRRSLPDGLELAVKGRLDAYWADHLTNALDEVIRDGVVRLSLDLSGVVYLSSGGITALVVAHRELGRVGGAMRLARLSEAVRSTLEMAGLLDLLVLQPQEPAAVGASGRAVDIEGGALEVWDAEDRVPLEYRLIGEPGRLAEGFGAEDCHNLTFPVSGFGLGIGAFGGGFDDCSGRFGELLAVAGAAVYQPTDGTNVPDFLLAKGAAGPETCLLYGLACSGSLSTHVRFQATDRPIEVSTLAAAALDLVKAEAVGIVAVAETAGLVGAALRRSPALDSERPDLSFPQVREWLSFTSDRAWPGCQALIVGVAVRSGAAEGVLAPFLRPVGSDDISGHFHAAAFSYRPLPRGPLELEAVVGGLFETEALRGLLHLVHDDRASDGLGESQLRRGALWLAPLSAGESV